MKSGVEDGGLKDEGVCKRSWSVKPGLRSRDLKSRVSCWAFRIPGRIGAPNIASSTEPRFRHKTRNGMLRLQRVGYVRNTASYGVRSGAKRPHSAHISGCNRDHGHSRSQAQHEHHAEHTTSRASARPVQTPPPLDVTVFKPAVESCQSLVFKRDYESFLTSKFYSNNTQAGFFALKAFYVYTTPLLLLLQS